MGRMTTRETSRHVVTEDAAPSADSAVTAGATGTAAKRNPIVAFLTRPVGGNANSPRRASRFTRWWRRHRPSDRALGWIAPLIVTAIGGFIRFFRLGTPNAILFDEHFYVKAAWTLLRTGVEREWPSFQDPSSVLTVANNKANLLFMQGQTEIYSMAPETTFTHPPLGKWIIALGIKIFGRTPFGWRFFPALAGTICILLVARVALRLFHNVTIATTAAILMAFDGHAITMSRVAMLDIFVTAFTLAAFLCLLNHRDWAKARLLAAHERDVSRPGSVIRTVPLTDRERRGEGGDTRAAAGRPSVRLVVDSSGPVVALSWWRLAAFAMLAVATGIKWSGGYFFAVFAVISVLWDAYNRRIVGYRGWFGALIAKDGLLTALYSIPLVVLIYLGTWASWLVSDDGYYRHWAQEHPGQGATWLPDTLNSLVALHRHYIEDAQSMTGYNPSESSVWDWPLQLKGTNLWWRQATQSDGGPTLLCNPSREQCINTIIGIGNPAVWWIGTPCLLLALFFAWRRRGDWRVLAVWSGIIAGWAPWLLYQGRTVYSYYSIAFVPWVILGTCYGLDWVLHRREPKKPGCFKRCAVALDVIATMFLVFLYPIWTFVPLTETGFLLRMLLPGWANGT